jgi:flagellar basal-body rod protein FlgC
MDLSKAMKISAAGMQAQSTRLRVISENLANSESMASEPGGEPYRRKTVTFKNALDRALGMQTVRINKIGVDQSELQKKYDPQHPAADPEGYVQLPNVNALLEVLDMRQAQRGYEANLNVIEVARGMLLRTIDVLRG